MKYKTEIYPSMTTQKSATTTKGQKNANKNLPTFAEISKNKTNNNGLT